MNRVSRGGPQVFEPDYYQRLYDIEEQHGWARGMRDAMAALLRQPLAGRKHLRVLDVGCGTGYLLEYLKRYPLACEPVGIDISAHALDFCRLRGASALALASATHLPFSSDSFDLIICIDTLQHLSPAGVDRVALTEFARLLRPGGLLYLRTNSALGRASLKGADPDQYRRYDLPTVAAMLAAAGLRVERATYLNMLPGVWAMLREYTRPGHQPAAPAGPGLSIHRYPRHLSWLNGFIYSVLRVEAWLVGKVHLSFPFGHSSAFVARRLAEVEG